MLKVFSHKFPENVWRILPDSDPDSDLWAIELREVPAKKASFAIIDLKESKLKWHESPEGTDWWTSLTAFSFGYLFLHNYRFPDLPQPTDLLTVSADDGELKWVLPNYLLVKSLNHNSIEVATKVGDQFKYFKCESKTGKLDALDENIYQPDSQVILREPVRYKEGNIYFDKLATFIRESTLGHQPVSIDYLEKRPFMMFSYYIYEQEKMLEYLLIVSDKMERIYHEKLSEGRDGIGRSTILLKGSRLVYLKNNNEFSSLTLP